VVYIVTNVDRATRCSVGWNVVTERTTDVLQALLDGSPPAKHYFSDQFPTDDTLIYYPADHRSLPNKSQTYAVEADNAELRHFLARLARKSRCFSGSLRALWLAIKLFVFAWNSRQLYKQAFPHLPAHLRDFVAP